MQIKINKNLLQAYKDDAWKGFSAREIVSILSGAGIAIGVVVILHALSGIRPAMAVYLGVPVAAPVIFTGFFRYQGYLTPGRILEEIRMTQLSERLVYASGEWEGTYRLVSMHKKPESKKRKDGIWHVHCQRQKAV